MSGNLVIFAEGRRDTEFLETLVEQHLGYESDRYDMGNRSGGQMQRWETNLVEQFEQEWNPYDVLLKSEGGDDKLLRAFPTVLKHHRDKDLEFCLLIDLDNHNEDVSTRQPADVVARLDREFARTAVRSATITTSGPRTVHGAVRTRPAEFRVNGDPECSFLVIGFRTSLEKVAEIDKLDDSTETKDRKARELADERDVREPIVQTLFE